MHAYSPLTAVLRGERPDEPLNAESLGFSGTLWGLVRLCWSESILTRPTARELFEWIPLPLLHGFPFQFTL